jgi:tetratricopeptide (TPR) repeat protein
MAQVYLTRGDLKRALALYEESLTIREQVGDLQGKGATLSGMANVYMAQNHWEQAAELVQQAVEIGKRMGDAERIAFDTTKLGQIAQASGDDETALAHYKEGLERFERLGMSREIQQVQGLIAQLQGGAPPAPADPLAQAVAQARSAAQAGDLPAAIQAQEQAVALVRSQLPSPPGGELAPEHKDALTTLSVLLYNLAGYYSQADRYKDAVQALEDVVRLDEQTDHQDLESDRQALEAARQMAALSPEEREQLRQNAPPGQDLPEELRQQLESLSPQERAQFEAAAAEFAARLQEISPAERQQLEIEALLGQVGAAAAAVRKGEAPLEAVLPQIEQAANRAAEGEEPGSPWDGAARYLRAVAAVLKGETPPPVPEAYAANLAALLEIDEPREGDKQDDRG